MNLKLGGRVVTRTLTNVEGAQESTVSKMLNQCITSPNSWPAKHLSSTVECQIKNSQL